MALITSPTTTAQQSQTDSSDKAGIDSDTPHHKHQQHLDIALLSRMISAKDVHKHSGGGGGSAGTGSQTNSVVSSAKLSFSVDSLLANKSTAVEAAKCLTSLFTR